jgi:hypothetical protein
VAHQVDKQYKFSFAISLITGNMITFVKVCRALRVYGTKGLGTVAESRVQAARGQRTRLNDLARDPKEWTQV